VKQRDIAAGRAGSVPVRSSGRPEDQKPTEVRRGAVRSAIRRQAAALGRINGVDDVTETSGPTERGDAYRSFGDGFTRAFELAFTPVIFGAVGYGIDNWIGIVPVFTIVFVLLSVIGLLLRTWYGYVYRMQALEQSAPWAKRA
jgi:hypothetical protein